MEHLGGVLLFRNGSGIQQMTEIMLQDNRGTNNVVRNPNRTIFRGVLIVLLSVSLFLWIGYALTRKVKYFPMAASQSLFEAQVQFKNGRTYYLVFSCDPNTPPNSSFGGTLSISNPLLTDDTKIDLSGIRPIRCNWGPSAGHVTSRFALQLPPFLLRSGAVSKLELPNKFDMNVEAVWVLESNP